jgi:hypothetical protein
MSQLYFSQKVAKKSNFGLCVEKKGSKKKRVICGVSKAN